MAACRRELPEGVQRAVDRYGKALEKRLREVPGLVHVDLWDAGDALVFSTALRENPLLPEQMVAAARRAKEDVDGPSGLGILYDRLGYAVDCGIGQARARYGDLGIALGELLEVWGDEDIPESAFEKALQSAAERVKGKARDAALRAPGLRGETKLQTFVEAAAKAQTGRLGRFSGVLLDADVAKEIAIADRYGFELTSVTSDCSDSLLEVIDDDVARVNSKIESRAGTQDLYGLDYSSTIVEVNNAGWTPMCCGGNRDYPCDRCGDEETGRTFAFYNSGFPGRVYFCPYYFGWSVNKWRRSIVVHEVVHLIDYEILRDEMGQTCPADACSAFAGLSGTEYTAAFMQGKWLGFNDCTASEFGEAYWSKVEEGISSTQMVIKFVWGVLVQCWGWTSLAIAALLLGGLATIPVLYAGTALGVGVTLFLLDYSFG